MSRDWKAITEPEVVKPRTPPKFIYVRDLTLDRRHGVYFIDTPYLGTKYVCIESPEFQAALTRLLELKGIEEVDEMIWYLQA